MAVGSHSSNFYQSRREPPVDVCVFLEWYYVRGGEAVTISSNGSSFQHDTSSMGTQDWRPCVGCAKQNETEIPVRACFVWDNNILYNWKQ